WRGGIAVGQPNDKGAITDNYILSKELPVECGINRVILRSLPQAGRIVFNASSAGLRSASVQLASTSSPETNGISKTLPDAGLMAHLDRGPAPAGDSIIPTRKTIHIVSATAGANDEQAAQAFDDNEATSWKNDGKRETGWIQFELEHAAKVSEITLKLGGWRNKAYPLRVTVDGKEAYSGTTPKSLGYVTLQLKPTQGRSVRIALAGAIQEGDAFGLQEVAGKKLTQGAGGGKGTLEIVEAEICEPLNGTAR